MVQTRPNSLKVSTSSLCEVCQISLYAKNGTIFNLKGKTQGKGEKQGPSVENKPFLWVRIEKICPEKKSVRRGHFFENVSILDTFLDTFFKHHNNITQRSETHTNNV